MRAIAMSHRTLSCAGLFAVCAMLLPSIASAAPTNIQVVRGGGTDTRTVTDLDGIASIVTLSTVNTNGAPADVTYACTPTPQTFAAVGSVTRADTSINPFHWTIQVTDCLGNVTTRGPN